MHIPLAYKYNILWVQSVRCGAVFSEFIYLHLIVRFSYYMHLYLHLLKSVRCGLVQFLRFSRLCWWSFLLHVLLSLFINYVEKFLNLHVIFWKSVSTFVSLNFLFPSFFILSYQPKAIKRPTIYSNIIKENFLKIQICYRQNSHYSFFKSLVTKFKGDFNFHNYFLSIFSLQLSFKF